MRHLLLLVKHIPIVNEMKWTKFWGVLGENFGVMPFLVRYPKQPPSTVHCLDRSIENALGLVRIWGGGVK